MNGKCYCSSPMSSKKSSLIPPFSTSTDDPFVISSRSYSNSNDLVSCTFFIFVVNVLSEDCRLTESRTSKKLWGKGKSFKGEGDSQKTC